MVNENHSSETTAPQSSLCQPEEEKDFLTLWLEYIEMRPRTDEQGDPEAPERD